MTAPKKTSPRCLKICGITRTEDVSVCLELEIDFVGFNFSAISPRKVNPEQASKLWSEAKTKSKKDTGKTRVVGIFVDPSLREVEAALKAFSALDVLQFHGKEDAPFLKKLRALPQMAGKKIWKAIQIKGTEELEFAKAFVDADAVLLDGPSPGSGKAFDWKMLSGHQFKLPWAIAGGINPANVNQALGLEAFLVDVSSGAESSVGIKDRAKIASLSEILRFAQDDEDDDSSPPSS